MEGVLNDGFSRWSQTWFTDRYVPNSTRVEEELATATGKIVRGKFSFSRRGNLLTIPFSADVRPVSSSYGIANLCYNDTSTGMTDCTSTGTSSATTNVMNMIIVGGLLAGAAGLPDSNGGKQCGFEKNYHSGGHNEDSAGSYDPSYVCH